MFRFAVAIVSLAVLAAPACSRSIRVNPVSPPALISLASVTVELGPDVRGNKETILVNLKALAAMGMALRNSIPAGGDKRLVVTLTKFRVSKYGPSFMHAVADIVGPDGQAVYTAEAHSQSMAGGRNSKVQRLAQDIVVKLIKRMPQDF